MDLITEGDEGEKMSVILRGGVHLTGEICDVMDTEEGGKAVILEGVGGGMNVRMVWLFLVSEVIATGKISASAGTAVGEKRWT